VKVDHTTATWPFLQSLHHVNSVHLSAEYADIKAR